MKAPVGFFYERPGVKSSMRLMCFLSLLFSFFITYVIVFNHIDRGTAYSPLELAIILLCFLSAFAPKAIQKFAESPVIEKIIDKGL